MVNPAWISIRKSTLAIVVRLFDQDFVSSNLFISAPLTEARLTGPQSRGLAQGQCQLESANMRVGFHPFRNPS